MVEQNMVTIEITEEVYELLCERAQNADATSLSDLIIAMDESCQIWIGKYMDMKEKYERAISDNR